MKPLSRIRRTVVYGFVLLSWPLSGVAEDYLQVHSYMEQKWLLMFTGSISGQAYANWGMAIEILEVNCDGVAIRPSEVNGLANIDTTYFARDVKSVTYGIDSESLSSSVWENGEIKLNKLRYYNIPKDAGTVCVRYRIHSADGKISPENTLTSVELNYARKHRDANGAINLSKTDEPRKPTGENQRAKD
jgi:hypothetical protein